MGLAEIALILIVALIVFGPDDLPRIARTLGKFFNQGRRIYQGFTKDFRDMINEPVNDLKSVESDIKQSLSKSIDVGSILDDSPAGKPAEKLSDEGSSEGASAAGDALSAGGSSSDGEASESSVPPESSALPEETLLRYEDLDKEEDRPVSPLEDLPEELVRDKRDES